MISAACGAVGSIAGQIAKRARRPRRRHRRRPGEVRPRGRRSSATTPASTTAPTTGATQLDAATPDGIDVDFENVGGPIMDHILGRLNIGARVSLCGMIAEYNTYNHGGEHAGGLTNIGQLIMQRATIQGFLVLDYGDRFEEAIGHLAGLLGEGKLHYDETIVDGGIEAAPDALAQLFTGQNMGKLLVRISD